MTDEPGPVSPSLDRTGSTNLTNPTDRGAPEPAAADWRHAARCRGTDPDALFVQGALQRDAREVCRSCPVRTECLAHALDNRIRFGVWGGMTERERRAVLRRRPDVISWAALLESARRAAERSPARQTPVRPDAPSRPARRAPGAGSAAAG